MEKRMIMAFVLSFLVLLMWSLLFAPKKEKAPKETEIPTKGPETIAESARTRVPKPAAPGISEKQKEPTMIPETAEREIMVDTPLYRARFASAGAVIKSFELKKYRLSTDPDSPPIELVNLRGDDGDFFQIFFHDQSTAKHEKTIYQVNRESIYLDPESSPQDLTFSTAIPDGVSVNQTYRFYPDTYQIDLAVSLVNLSERQVSGNLRAQLKNLPPNKKGYYSFVGLALFLNEEGLEKIKPKKMKEERVLSGRIGWMAYEEDYFMTAIIPNDSMEGSFRGRLLPSGVLAGTYMTPAISLGSKEEVLDRFTLYLGPRDLTELKLIGKQLDRAINFGWTTVIAKPLLYALRFFNKYVKNYGLSIIILTILIKIIFWPLTHKSYKSMKDMQKMQPLMAKIREKYKNNKEQMNRELMSLYRTYKINPMGGCLPMIIQIPVFFALFRILGNSIELRHAPFVLWIDDLAAPDRLFNFPFQIPFMSAPYGIPVLTLLMGASMFIQQKMTPTPGDPSQAKIMLFLPLIFTVMFVNFPSGLVLYWLVNNLLSIGQQYRIKKSTA